MTRVQEIIHLISPPPSLQITMARGKTRGHKGGRKQFSTADQIKDDIAKAEERRKWREQHPDSDSEEESEEEQKQSRSKVSHEFMSGVHLMFAFITIQSMSKIMHQLLLIEILIAAK